MTVIALISMKHAPGATTAMVALGAASTPPALVVEADPAGGDVAARAHLPLDPGLVTLAAAARHPAAAADVLSHAQRLATGGLAIVAPTAPDQAGAVVAALADRLPRLLRASAHDAVIDCGRWSVKSPVNPILDGCDHVLVVAEPSVSGVEHVRSRLDSLAGRLSAPIALLLVGDRPYGAPEVEAALSVRVVGQLAVDPRGSVLVHHGPAPAARRSLLVRSARTVLAQLRPASDAVEATA